MEFSLISFCPWTLKKTLLVIRNKKKRGKVERYICNISATSCTSRIRPITSVGCMGQCPYQFSLPPHPEPLVCPLLFPYFGMICCFPSFWMIIHHGLPNTEVWGRAYRSAPPSVAQAENGGDSGVDVAGGVQFPIPGACPKESRWDNGLTSWPHQPYRLDSTAALLNVCSSSPPSVHCREALLWVSEHRYRAN